MADHGSFTDHVLANAASVPDREAMILLDEATTGAAADDPASSGAGPRVVRYGELDRQARALAAVLQDHGVAGKRVLVVLSSRLRFAVSLLACLYSGAIAVPVPPPPGRRRHHGERLARIVRDAAARCALADSATAAEVSQLLALAGYGGVTCLAVDDLPPTSPGHWRHPELTADSVAFLQYTSGSTADPRGVVVTHRNLLANQRAIQQALGTGAGSRFGGWLPFHHDLGLVGQLLHPLWLGATTVMLSPHGFVRRPARWLQMISEYGVTVSGAPDFAYDLCTRRVSDAQLATVDLSGWQVAVNGGEPVRPETVRGFTARFAAAGFRAQAMVPCYGLAEATLLVSGAATGAPPTVRPVDPAAPARALVGCGPARQLRIVDPDTHTVLPDGRVGEIWVRGDSVGAGYWKRPGDSQATFGATTADGQAGFLRTGDLGVIDGGELFVTGRIKDVILVAGRNVYPQDVEGTVRSSHRMFAANSAFGVPGERERVVVVQEVRRSTRHDLDYPSLAELVRRRVQEEFDVAPGGVVLVRVGSVLRTTSGKTERAAMRRLFLSHKLQPLHQAVTADVARLVDGGGR